MSEAISAEVIRKLNKSQRFLGIYFIIMGAITCLGIITAVVGIPMLISGLRLRESADSFDKFTSTGSESDLELALSRQERFFFIQKIMVIIGLVFVVLYMIGIFLFIGAVGMEALGDY